MTTIACNRTEIASDLQFTNINTGNKWKGKTKIYEFKAHPNTYSHSDFIVGFAGSASDIITISEFFSMPEAFKAPPRTKGCLGLVLTHEGLIYTFDDYTKWLLVNQPYTAIGSGANYALGAMATGASPKEAIKIASKHDSYTGLGVKSYSIA